MEVGIITDLGFYSSFDSNQEQVVEAIELIVALTNLLYYYQFNVILRVRQIIITTDFVGGVRSCTNGAIFLKHILSQDPTKGTCCYSIDDVLDGMEAFSKALPVEPISGGDVVQTYEEAKNNNDIQQLAHWHMLTDCYPAICSSAPCTVGLAWSYKDTSGRKNSLCRENAGTNTAVSSRTFQTWITFAHELGHNFGSPHTFENGQGKTGGLMDYGDGKYKGEYQFNTKYRRAGLCYEMELLTEDKLCEREQNGGGIVDLLPQYIDDCFNQSDYTVCSIGVCFNEKCTPLETQLKVNNNINSVKQYRIETAEFSAVSPYSPGIAATLAITEPSNGCSNFAGNYVNKIAIVKRGDCAFTIKAQNALDAGARALIVYNNEDGAPQPIGGEGFIDIPVVSISKDDGEEILSSMKKSNNVTGYIGGLPALVKDFPEDIITIWSQYRILFVVFISLSVSLSTLYIYYMHSEKIKKELAKTWENIYDASAETFLKVRDKIDDLKETKMIRSRSSLGISESRVHGASFVHVEEDLESKDDISETSSELSGPVRPRIIGHGVSMSAMSSISLNDSDTESVNL